MPGGRGDITDIALALNNANHKEVAHAIKMAIDQGSNGYTVNASIKALGIAYANCQNKESLTDVWCHALEKNMVSWEY